MKKLDRVYLVQKKNGYYYVVVKYAEKFKKPKWMAAGNEETRARRYKNVIEEELFLRNMGKREKIKKSATLAQFKEIVLNHYEKQPDRSEKSTASSTIALDYLTNFTGEIDLRRLDYELMQKWVQWLSQQVTRREMPLSVNSINNFIRTNKAAFNLGYKWGYLDVNPLDDIKELKEKRKPIRNYFLESEVKKVREALKEHEPSWTLEMFNFFLWHGLRSAETMNLKADDIDFELMEMNVLGKGEKYREVPLLKRVVKLLKKRIEKLDSHFPPPEDLELIHYPGRKKAVERFHDKYIFWEVSLGTSFNKILVRHFKKLKVKGSLHNCRHTFATFYLIRGGRLEVLQKILGHESISTTQIYAVIANKLLKKGFDKYSGI